MGNRNNPKPDPKKAAKWAQREALKQEARKPSRRLLRWVIRWARRLGAAWKLVAGIAASCGFLFHTYLATVPIVSLSGSDPSPFLLPFVVKNESLLFDMRDVTFFCAPRAGQIVRVGNISLQDLSFRDGIPPRTIAPFSQPSLFRCPVSNASGELVRASIHPIVKDKTLWFDRMYEGKVDYNWFPDAKPPRWIEPRCGQVSKSHFSQFAFSTPTMRSSSPPFPAPTR